MGTHTHRFTPSVLTELFLPPRPSFYSGETLHLLISLNSKPQPSPHVYKFLADRVLQ